LSNLLRQRKELAQLKNELRLKSKSE
jgi:hypothetical protein